MSDKSDLKAELERKKQRLAQIREEKKRKEEERKKKEVNILDSPQLSLPSRICLVEFVTCTISSLLEFENFKSWFQILV